jgi:hypothetical protein
MLMIINIEDSPIRSRRYRIFLLDGSKIDIGSSKEKNNYIDTGNKKIRKQFYTEMDSSDKIEFMKMRPSRVVLEACILNGPTRDIIKNINCSGEVVLQYDKIKKSDKGKPIANKDLKAFTVYFINDFNDSIQGYVNDRLCYDKYLKINSNSDNLKDSFGYNYSKDEKTPVLKVISKTKKICFDIEINKKVRMSEYFIVTN